MKERFQVTPVFVMALAGILVMLNVLSLRSLAPLRLDVTSDQAYTLSKASKDTMAGLEDAVTITAYFTKDLPAPYSGNARYVRDLLTEYRAASKDKLSFEFIDPAAQESDEDKEAKREVKQDIFGRQFREPTAQEKELASVGVQPVEIRVVQEDQMQTKRAYMGLVIKHQEKKEVIPVLQDTRSLEYDLTSLIRKLARPKTPVIGLIQGHEEPKTEEHLKALHQLLSQTYELRPLNLGDQDKIGSEFDAVLVVGPKTPLKPNELKAIDQFLMQGKSVGLFLDSVSLDTKTFETTPANHGLAPLLSTYGVKLGESLVADADSASLNVQERRGFMVVNMPLPYPFIPMIKQLEGDSPVSKGLGQLTFPFVNPITTTPAEGRTVTVLARSSKMKSWLEKPPFNTDPRRDWRSETIVPSGPYDLMVQISGKLPSHFASEASQSSSGKDAPLLAESKADARLMVVGGSALLQDSFMERGSPNQALALNIADWLLLDPALLAMRTRGLVGAPIKADLSDGVRNGVKYGNILGLPVLLIAYGLFRWRMRESRRRTAVVGGAV